MLLHKLASSLKPSGAAQRPALEAAEQRLVLLVLTSVVGPGHANALELVMPCRTSLPAAVSSSASYTCIFVSDFLPQWSSGASQGIWPWRSSFWKLAKLTAKILR